VLIYADAAVVSGLVWQSLPAADRELITKSVKTTLARQGLRFCRTRRQRSRRAKALKNRPMLPNVGLKAA
jgi:TRAP-type C4-dicarboxylate transport system substrate-binding protein